jgi:hypothetical protein
VPASVPECPPFLLAEAVGQLAAWATMAHLDFRARPVAALAGEVIVGADALGGDLVDLTVHIDGIERGGAVYGGSATAHGRDLLVMKRCVGPLLPMADFDDPEAVRDRLRLLCDRGLGPGGLVPVAPPAVAVLEEEPGQRLRVSLQVPLEAPFFAEHFPRRPVYPATILLDAKIRVARQMLGEQARRWRVRRVTHVKISAFTSPGEVLEVEAVRVGGAGDEATVQLTGLRAGVRVSRARMEFQSHAV